MQPRAHAHVREGGTVRLAEVLPAAAVFEIDEDAVGQLLQRGIDRPVAERLVGHHGPERVRRQVRNYDRVGPRSVGWLVKAIEEDFAVR